MNKPMILTAALATACSAAAAEDTGHGHGRHHSPHAIGAFAGFTDPDDHPAEATWGVEYEYRPGDRFGFGVIAERTSEAHDGDGVDVAVAAVHYHVANFRLTAGAGREWIDGHGSHALQRLGIAYDIELGPIALAPTVNVDFVDGEEVPVYGLVLLKHF